MWQIAVRERIFLHNFFGAISMIEQNDTLRESFDKGEAYAEIRSTKDAIARACQLARISHRAAADVGFSDVSGCLSGFWGREPGVLSLSGRG
ncbi:MAG TPA: hypothetical protein VGM07_03355 [Stellaceae bacterium]